MRANRGSRKDSGNPADRETGPAKAGGSPIRPDTVNRAIGDVRYIRDLIDASHDFFVSGWSGVAAGIITVIGVILTALIIAHPGRWNTPRTLWALWVIIAAVLLASDVFFFMKRSREVSRPVFSLLLAKLAFVEVLMGVQGLILTLVFIRAGNPEYIPAAWLLTFGTILTGLGLFIPGGVWILGLASLAAAAAAFIVPSGGLWCAGFVGGAMCLWGAAYLITRGR